MRVLCTGLPFGTPGEPVRYFCSQHGHEMRMLVLAESDLDVGRCWEGEGGCTYGYGPEETCAAIMTRLEAEGWRPDMLMCWTPEVVPPPLGVEECPVRTVAVVSDWTVYGAQLYANLGRYDAVVTDRDATKSLRVCQGVRPNYLGPLYSQRRGVHGLLAGGERDIDILFVGNLNHSVHRFRGYFLEQVALLSNRFRVVITSGLTPVGYGALLNRARIVFNFTLRGEMNLRCFEALACGAVLFVEAENGEVRDLLTESEDVVFYRAETLVSQLTTCLAKGDFSREGAVRRASLAGCIAGEQRLDDFLTAVVALPDSGRPFKMLEHSTQLLAEGLQYGSCVHEKRRAYAQQCFEVGRMKFPDIAVYTAGLGCMLLEDLAWHKKGDPQSILTLFREAAVAAPDSAVLWLNLAFVCRRAGAIEAEKQFLQRTTSVSGVMGVEVLLGERNDVYYAQFREALARGEDVLPWLHGGAYTRLAALAYEEKQWSMVTDYAQQSIALCAGVAEPYWWWARALEKEGRIAEAASVLEESLPLTVFDAAHRKMLVRLWLSLGRAREAQELAEKSFRIFKACWGREETAAAFCEMIPQNAC